MKNTIISRRNLLTLVLAFVMAFTSITTVLATPIEAQAATKSYKYFKDVTSKTKFKNQVNWMQSHGGFKHDSITKGRTKCKFKPGKIAKQGDVKAWFEDLYAGENVTVTIESAGKLVNQKFFTDTMTSVSKQLGYRMTYSGGTPDAKVSRARCQYYIKKLMIDAAEDGALDP